MKKRILSLLMTCVMCLCLAPAALAADLYDQYPYEVSPFRIEDFSPNPGNATYVGSDQPTIEIREMTINGETVEVSVFPAGTKFQGLGEVGFGDTTTYLNGERDIDVYYDPHDGLPEQGVYQVRVYSIYYGYLADMWVTAEGSGSTEPEPEPEPEPEQIFTDVAPDAWYAGFVETVYEKNLFAGNGDGTFGPDANMDYAQFLTVLSQFSGETISGVAGGAWYDGYVNWAKEKGLIPEEMLASFNPTAPITRQDMAALFGAFLEVYNVSYEKVTEEDSAYTDAASIAGYAAEGVNVCYQAGIMSGGDDGSFAPLATATRAQVAVTMVQMARVMGR